jgi:hypothetical protein
MPTDGFPTEQLIGTGSNHQRWGTKGGCFFFTAVAETELEKESKIAVKIIGILSQLCDGLRCFL